MRTVGFLAAIALAAAAWAFELNCACDPTNPETLSVRQCSLCREAEKQPPDQTVFFLKDINPRKANRTLALPRKHLSGGHHLHEMTPAERAGLWTAAIEKAKSLWGDQWGIAYNGANARTQCHAHVHIGRFLPAVETEGFLVVKRVHDIPAPPNAGIWVHPVKAGLHVHTGEQITETVLLR